MLPEKNKYCNNGWPKKRLSEQDVSSCAENNILDPIVRELEKVDKTKDTEIEELLKKLVKRCNLVWKSEENNEISHMPVKAACAMIYKINWSINQYQEKRLIWKQYKFLLLISNDIDAYKKTLIPPISDTETKTSCDFLTMIKQTVSALVDLKTLEAIASRNNYKLDSRFGLDGSNSHQIQQQSAENADDREETANYIGAIWCPLELKVNGNVLWKNPRPNLTLYAHLYTCLFNAWQRNLRVC